MSLRDLAFAAVSRAKLWLCAPKSYSRYAASATDVVIREFETPASARWRLARLSDRRAAYSLRCGVGSKAALAALIADPDAKAAAEQVFIIGRKHRRNAGLVEAGESARVQRRSVAPTSVQPPTIKYKRADDAFVSWSI